MFNIRFDASWSPRSSDENLNSLAACILKLNTYDYVYHFLILLLS
jgi:hypothetical protein